MDGVDFINADPVHGAFDKFAVFGKNGHHAADVVGVEDIGAYAFRKLARRGGGRRDGRCVILL